MPLRALAAANIFFYAAAAAMAAATGRIFSKAPDIVPYRKCHEADGDPRRDYIHRFHRFNSK